MVARSPFREDGIWQAKHKKVRSQLGISPDFRPWTEAPSGQRPKLEGVTDNARYRDTIDIAWAAALMKNPMSPLPFYVNFSQCPTRKPWSSALRCLTTSTKVYDFARDKVLSSEELLLLQGIPAPDLKLHMFSESSLLHAVGEAMFCPCIGAIMLGVYLNPHAPWWQTSG
jgi:hypothetical protein